MSQDTLFDGSGAINPSLHGMIRASCDKTADKDAAIASLPVVEANRRLILSLLVEHEWLTMFCPYVLVGHQYRQTVIGPRFPRLERSGLIVCVGKRRPRAGAESQRLVSAFEITPNGRDYLSAVSRPEGREQ